MKNEMLITHIDGVEMEISVISETPFFVIVTTSTLCSLLSCAELVLPGRQPVVGHVLCHISIIEHVGWLKKPLLCA